MTHFTRTIAQAALAFALLGLSTAASASVPAKTYRLQVRYWTSELATEAGAEDLYHRIRRSARAVCFDNGALMLPEVFAARACQRELMNKAVDTLDSARIADVHHNYRRIQLSSR